MFLIAEGPDGAGKSTLLARFKELLPDALICHHGPYKGLDGTALAQRLLDSMAPALAGKTALMDRCWYSELIYGQVFRHGEVRLSATQVRLLERVARAADARMVLCLPNYAACEAAFTSGRAEMLESTQQLRAVYQRYVDLVPTMPALQFDYAVNDATHVLEAIKGLSWPRPKVILLGDQPNARTHAQDFEHVPFVSFKRQGCSLWLTEQLESAGIPEIWLEWHNVQSAASETLDPKCLTLGVPVIAMGTKALGWCVRHKVECSFFAHPQWHKRFHPREPYPLINYLKEKFHGKEQSS